MSQVNIPLLSPQKLSICIYTFIQYPYPESNS
uniref:Uncharacterized protein n=1 Tax=Anguilla anguilla TaxID=7936 RepID=A0A0E9UD60_ANGAN